jgi:hypothetical protein
MTLRLALLLAVAGRGLAGQSVAPRLAGRVPEAAVGPVDSIARSAAESGLPVDPIVKKALEGGAKHAPPGLIVAAAGQVAEQLREARALLVRGDTVQPRPKEITAVAAALGRGLPPKLARRIVAAFPEEPTGPPLHAVADLVGHGFAQDAAVDLVIEGSRQGLRGVRLLDVATAAVHELQRGRSHREALATVRGELPDVPTPPSLPGGAFTRARRPAGDTTPR